jgi:transmembrane sensor
MSRFKDLMERFLADRITVKERHELFSLIRSGHYRNELGNGFMEEVKARADNPKTLGFITEEIFAALAEEHAELAPDKTPGVVPIHHPTISWWKIAAVAMLTLAVGVALSVYWHKNRPRPVESEHPGTVAGTMKALHTFSGKQYVRLPDGSKVILNAGSVLQYGEHFGREVSLTGEAYFDIRHDDARPFKVRTGKIMTTVHGTAFNVKAYSQENQIIITVEQGLVEVSDEGQPYEMITTDEQIAINTTSHRFVKNRIDVDVPLQWKSRFIILDAVTLEEAAAIISEHYKVTVTLENERLKQCKITSTFLNDEKIQDVLEVISTALNATFTMQGDNVMIRGKGCNKR